MKSGLVQENIDGMFPLTIQLGCKCLLESSYPSIHPFFWHTLNRGFAVELRAAIAW